MSVAAAEELRDLPPAALRQRFREGLDADTGGLAMGYVQASVTVIPQEQAEAFLRFCARNRLAAPLLEVLAPGAWAPRAAPDADIRTDLPAYRVVEGGQVREVPDLLGVWRDDLVAFVLGCGYSHVGPLLRAGVRLRHLDEGRQQAVYLSSLQTEPVGPFGGRIAVSMLPIRGDQVATAVRVTARYPFAHGAPIWIGGPRTIGVSNLARPLTGDMPQLHYDETPVFWACSKTSWHVASGANLRFFAQHAPARMLITDLLADELAHA